MPPDVLIVPPPGTVGVWCDTRGLEAYPAAMRQRRGPLPRAVVACRQVLLTWHAQGSQLDEGTLTALHAARKQILAFSRQARVLNAKRVRCGIRVATAVVKEVAAPAVHDVAVGTASAITSPKPPPPVSPSAVAMDVPQDDFMAALTAVFG